MLGSLKVELLLNKKVPIEELEDLVKLAKGKTRGEINVLELEENKLTLQLKGKHPNFILLMLRNLVTSKLGRKLKAGIKEMRVLSFTYEFDLPMKPLAQVRIPFAKEVKMDGLRCKLSIDESKVDESFLKGDFGFRMAELVKEKVKMQHYKGKEELRRNVEVFDGEIKFKEDPNPLLERIGWIRHTGGKGQYIYGVEITALMRSLHELILDKVFKPMGFYEMILPKVELWEIPCKTGHASFIEPYAYFACIPKSASEEYWEEVLDLFKITGRVPVEKVMERIENIGILCWAQCPPFWKFFEGKRIDDSSLPIKIYDWSGPSFRYEAGGVKGLERVDEFHRLEAIWIAYKDEALSIWKEVIERMSNLLKELKLKFRRSLLVPSWMGVSEETEAGVYDLDVFLPYKGGWLEVAGITHHGDKFIRAFHIKCKSEKELASGCFGCSAERFAISYLAQKGLNPNDWHPELRERFLKKLEGFKGIKLI